MRVFAWLLVLVVWQCVGSSRALAETRRLSLEDCIRIALDHNLELQIRRLDPQIAGYTLSGNYGSYEPQIQLSATHSYNQSPGGVDAQGRQYAGRELESDNFRGGFGGLLPWGLSYSLGMGMTDQTITTPPQLAFGQPVVTANTFYDVSTSNTVVLLSTNYPVGFPGYSERTVSGQAAAFELRQPLLKNFWTDSTRLQILIDKQNVVLSELDVRQQVITTITEVEAAFFNLIFAQENILVQKAALQLAERLLAENKKRVEVGALAPLDERQAEAQAAASRADLLEAEGNEYTQQRVLKHLLSDEYGEWQTVVIQPGEPMVAVPERFELQESWRRGLSLRPDLQQQKIALEKQGYIVKFSKNQLFPQLDVVGSYGYSASDSDWSPALEQIGDRDNPFWSVGGQLSMPLGNRSARNNYRAAKANQQRIALQLKQLQQRILIAIEDAISVAETSLQRVKATREAREYAEQALEAEQKKLESGKSTSFEVLRLQRDLTAARLSEIRALADYNISLARIAASEGSTLERRRVNISFD
jgi:outer membrane protein TolC